MMFPLYMFNFIKNPKIKGRYEVVIFETTSLVKSLEKNYKEFKEHFTKHPEKFNFTRLGFDNIVPNVGLQLLADNLNSITSHIAVGTGTATPTLGDIALQIEAFRDLINDDRTGTNSTTATFLLDSDEANGNTLTEIGAFANSGVDIVSRALIPTPIIKTDQKTVTFEITHTFSNS